MTITRNIDIIFGGINKGLKKTLFDIETDLTTFGSGIESVATPVGDLTKSLLKAEAAVAAMGVAMVGVSINEAGQFTGAISEIGALFNATSEQADQLGQDILNFSRGSVSAIDDINSATFTAISTGTEWTEVTKLLSVAEILAVAGASELSSATEILSRSLNIYGTSAGSATEVSEALFVAAQQGDTNFTKLAASLGEVLQPAQAASVEFDELLAAVAAVTIGTGNTAKTMTLLKSLFKELASPSKELSVALNGMSLETDSLQAIMQQLQKETGGQFAAMDALFSSTEAVNGALILSTDTSGKFASALDAMRDKTGQLQKSYDQMASDFGNVNQNLVNNVKATLIDAGIPLLDEYGTAVGALSEIFKAVGVDIKSGGLKDIESAVEGFVGRSSELLAGIANALPEALEQLDFSSLLDSFGDLEDVIKDVFDRIFGEELDLTKPEDLAKALQTGVNLAESLVSITGEIITQFGPIFDTIGLLGSSVAGTSDETEKAIGKLAGSLTLLAQFGPLIGSVAVFTQQTGADIESTISRLAGAAKVIINVLQTAFDTFALGIVVSAKGISNGLAAVTFGDTSKRFEAQATEFDFIAKGIATNLVKNAGEISDGWNEMVDGVSKGTEGLTKNAEQVGEASTDIDKLSNTTAGVSEAFKKMGFELDPVTGKVTQLASAAENTKSSIDQLAQSSNNSGQQLITIGNAAESSSRGLEKAKDATKDLSDSQKLAINNGQELAITLLELASDERISNIKFGAAIDIAQIEADAATTVAAFESISSSVDSTNDLIAELFSHDAPDWDKFGFDTQEALDRAQDRAERLTNSQIELNAAQIELMLARAEALSRGDAAITINADSLAPELQTLLKSLMDLVQVEANAEGLELLIQ